jgi:excisionase family DNA binding protein
MTLETETVMVNRADLETFISRLSEVEEAVHEIQTSTAIRHRVEANAKGNMLNAAAVCRILNWSRRTFYRRVDAGEIPVILEGGGHWQIGVDEFMEWYEKNYK